MDYFQKVEESIKFSWKYKGLWVFGFILSIFGGGTGTNWGSGFNNRSENFDRTNVENGWDSFVDFISKPEVIIAIVLIGIALVVISLIGWYLSSVSKGALINSVDLDKKGETPTLSKGWDYGTSRAFRFMKMDLILFLINIVVMMPMLLVIIATALFIPFVILLCLLIPFYFVYFIGIEVVNAGAQRYLVIKDLSATESLKRGWGLAKNYLMEYVVGWLVSVLTSCAWSLIIVPIVIILVMIGVVLGVASVALSTIFGVLVIIFLVLLFIGFIVVINSPYVVFAHTYWTKVIMELMERETEMLRTTNTIAK